MFGTFLFCSLYVLLIFSSILLNLNVFL
jgi:hypothetical protein